VRQPAGQRRRPEQRQPDPQQTPTAERVGQPRTEQQETAERGPVKRHDVGQVRLADTQPALDRGQRDIHDADIEKHHELRDAQERQHQAGPKHTWRDAGPTRRAWLSG
jgi:hypothetical protein